MSVVKIFIMRQLLLIFAVMAVAAARPQNPVAQITKFISDIDPVGGYNFAFESDDGIKREESAQIINQGQENESIAVKGAYSYVGDDGKTYEVTYTADENGFQPEGEHIPKVGIPPAALASLAG